MKAENEFAAYLTGDRPSCEAAYLNSRLFPAINALAKKARRCARTQLWLTVGECIAALCLPLLSLFPFAIPDAALKLALASLGMLIAAALFAQQILHLPQRAADCAAKAERLRKLAHAYFLGVEEFESSPEGACRLRRLCEMVEHTL